MTHTRRLLAALAVLVLGCAVAGAAEAEQPTPREWLTRAEASDFKATAGYEETVDFIRRLTRRMPQLRLVYFGTSAMGRPLPAVIVSGDFAFDPARAHATAKAIVMVQNGIHSGEIDGKDACLMILRDMALGRHRDLLEGVILVIVPIYNVDGHERVSPYNRANQNGPVEGMGFRTTADGHDLNRDHVKLVTPEARALVGLFNKWRPDLHVDNHVTNGSDHDWVLTYAWAEAPQAPPSVDAWLQAHMPRVLEATERAGHPVGPYVSLLDRSDPSKGFDSFVGGPRYSTGYFPTRNRPSLLVENHAYKPYRDRVLANRDFLLALFREIADDPAALRGAVLEADRRTEQAGRPDAPRSELVLSYRRSEEPDTILWPVYEWYSEPSQALGGTLVRYRRGEVRETEVPWMHRAEPELTVARPRGYLVLPGWPVIEQRLRDHGLHVERLLEDAELEVETMRLSNPRQSRRSNPSYQGQTLIGVDVTRGKETRRCPAGTLWIPADQPDFEIAAQLLEPEAPDSLVSWGLLSIVMERKEYIDPGVLEDQVRVMLEDPVIAAEWKRALDDEAFAGDRWARWLWWYRRTPHWDDTVGLMPVMRVMGPPGFSTKAWEGSAEGRSRRVLGAGR
jgi:hypothetical protein